MEIRTLVNNYLDKGNVFEAQRAELQEKVAKKRESLERIRKQIQRLEDQERNLPYPSWFECILHPLAQTIAKELGLEYDIYGPFGMRGQVTLYFMKDKEVSITEQPVKRLVLIPVNLGEGELGYETGKAKDGVSEPLDHVRDPNGFSREVLPLPNDFKDILALIRPTDKVEESSEPKGFYQAYIKNLTTGEWLKEDGLEGEVVHTADESEMLVFYEQAEAENTLEFLNDNYSDSYILLIEDNPNKWNRDEE